MPFVYIRQRNCSRIDVTVDCGDFRIQTSPFTYTEAAVTPDTIYNIVTYSSTIFTRAVSGVLRDRAMND